MTAGVIFTLVALIILFMLYFSVHLDPEETRNPVFLLLAFIALFVIPMTILGVTYKILREMVSEKNEENRQIDLTTAMGAITTFAIYCPTVYGIAIFIAFQASKRC